MAPIDFNDAGQRGPQIVRIVLPRGPPPPFGAGGELAEYLAGEAAQ